MLPGIAPTRLPSSAALRATSSIGAWRSASIISSRFANPARRPSRRAFEDSLWDASGSSAEIRRPPAARSALSSPANSRGARAVPEARNAAGGTPLCAESAPETAAAGIPGSAGTNTVMPASEIAFPKNSAFRRPSSSAEADPQIVTASRNKSDSLPRVNNRSGAVPLSMRPAGYSESAMVSTPASGVLRSLSTAASASSSAAPRAAATTPSAAGIPTILARSASDPASTVSALPKAFSSLTTPKVSRLRASRSFIQLRTSS